MLIAAQGWTWVTIVFIVTPLLFLWYYYKTLYCKKRTRFFLAWSTISFFFLLGVFELEVVPYLEIMFMENFALMCFVATTGLFIFLVKSNSQPASFSAVELSLPKTDQLKKTRCDICSTLQPVRTYHCDLCGYCIHKRDHHSIWLDICIGSRNQKYYIVALIALLASCLYSSNLTLTTICHPTLLGGVLLMPEDCSDVFGDIHIAICFVSAVYTLMIAALGFYHVFLQIWLICYNSTFLEWKQGQLGVYSKGLFKNFMEFSVGRTWSSYYGMIVVIIIVSHHYVSFVVDRKCFFIVNLEINVWIEIWDFFMSSNNLIISKFTGMDSFIVLFFSKCDVILLILVQFKFICRNAYCL